MSRREPNWGQSRRTLGPAGGKHTRGNQGRSPGCLDAVIVAAGSLAAIGAVIGQVIRS